MKGQKGRVVDDGTMTNESFRQVVEQYQKLVFTVCYQLVRDYQEAENLTQETFLSAYTHIDHCNPSELKPWLSRIAANKAKDHLKSAYVRRVQLAQDGEEQPQVFQLEPSAEDLAICRDEVRRMEHLIYDLKEPYHQAAVLFFLEDKTIDEIAQRLNRPKKTIQTQIYRAKQLLKQKLKEESS